MLWYHSDIAPTGNAMKNIPSDNFKSDVLQIVQIEICWIITIEIKENVFQSVLEKKQQVLIFHTKSLKRSQLFYSRVC